MVNKCLNCGLDISKGKEFCKYCEEDLDVMVDNRDIAAEEEVEMTQSSNPFFSDSRMTGNVVSSSENSIAKSNSEDDSSGFFNALLVISLLMALMIFVFL